MNSFFNELITQSGLTNISISDHPGYTYASDIVENVINILDGDMLQVGEFSFQCIETSGHAPDHFCLYDPERKILFFGDHILGKITPNNTIWAPPATITRDYLGEYLKSLDKVSGLDLEVVFPGHRYVLEDGYTRIEELKSHHQRLLESILTILGNGSLSGAQVAGQMQWDLSIKSWEDFPPAQKIFATGEALATDPQELLAQKRASGGEKEISWKLVDTSLATHTKDRLDNVAIEIDYFASEYVQYKTRIEQYYIGEEQQAELANQESLFATRVGEAAANFAKGVGNFLAANGVAGEHDALRNSFLDIYEQRKADYLNFIAENDDYAHVKGTVDEWLLTASDFMGEQLRYAYISQHPEMNLTSQYGYSVDDLNAVGILTGELINAYAGKSSRSEVEVGVRLGLAAAAISRHFDISSSVASKLEQSMNHYLKGQLEKGSELIEQRRNGPYIRNKDPFAIDFNQHMAWEIIQRLVKDLSSAKDITAVFKSDLDAFMALYKRQSDDILMGCMDRYSSHQSRLWMNENYAADWNHFVRQLAAFNYEEANRYLIKEPTQSVDISV